MNLLTDKQVAIIGGGPAGLMTAVLLQQRGAHVTVYEREAGPDARIWGGTLDIHRNSGQLAFEAAGLLSELYKVARPTAERVVKPDGTIIEEDLLEEATAYFKPEIDRSELRQLLLGALRPGTVVWGQQFANLDAQTDGRLALHFVGQPTQVADVVIGANGGRSRVRHYTTGTEPQYSGTAYIQGDVHQLAAKAPALAALINGGNLVVLGERNTLASHTKADGSLELGVSVRVPEGGLAAQGISGEQPATVRALLHTLLADWAPLFHEGFAAVDEWRILPLYVVPVVAERPVTQAITLVGDAAHLMPPFAGVGVNTGLLDALHLADCLTNGAYADLPAAITAYEQLMYTYAHEAQRMTSEAELSIHGEQAALSDPSAMHSAWNELMQSVAAESKQLGEQPDSLAENGQ